MVDYNEISHEGLRALEVSNRNISFITVPALGGKIISLTNKNSGFDFIYNNTAIKNRIWEYNSDFSITNASGIDECFPTVGKSKYKEFPWDNINIPDHGEIWTQDLKTKISEKVINQGIYGVRFPYYFNRKIILSKNKLIFNYHVTNLSSYNFKYIWSFHPIFKLLPGTQIGIDGNPDMYLDYSTNNRFQLKVKKYRWPIAIEKSGKKIDFSNIDITDSGDAEKIYLNNLFSGKVDVYYTVQKEKISAVFDIEALRYLGVWINRKGWPFNKNKIDSMAIEPCNCVTDKFEDSVKRGAFGILEGNSRASWEIELIMG